ncbi:hypothetical protein [Egicoccus sp. AB-alg6-2]|uniref:hypothetical protein n=1 Tax=Egicoccus sp. AB-alg6-2 TaxID=3242692 RepID=UPI00359EF58E
MAVILSSTDVIDLLTFDEAIDVTERVYRDSNVEDRRVHSPVRMKLPRGSLRIVTGALLNDNVMGARLGSASGLAGNMSPIVLFEADSGNILAIMAYPFSIMRTGVTVAVGTKWISPEAATTAALIGAGRNALSALEGMIAVRPITAATVYSRTAEKRDALADIATRKFGIPVTAVGNSDEAVADADLIACVTSATDHVFDPAKVLRDVHVNSVGSVNEVPDAIFRAAAGIFLGSKKQELQYAHYHSFAGDAPRNALLELIETGEIDWDAVHDLDAALKGWSRPRPGPTVFKETRGGVGDVALAHFAYERARELGRGLPLQL